MNLEMNGRADRSVGVTACFRSYFEHNEHRTSE
jgi:hypothetical protein